MSIRTLALAATILGLTGCASAAPDTPPAIVQVSPAADIAALVSKAQQAAPYPAIAVSVRKGDEVIYEGAVGIADLEQDTSATPETVFAIGSITKSFTSIAISQQVAAGKVDLDAPVGTYLKDYAGPAKDAPVWTLMNHTSGLINFNSQPDFPSGSRREFTRREMRDMFETHDLMFPSGSAFSYSNSGTYLLGLIVEAVSGQTYDQYLTENVLSPLGLEHTYYNLPSRVIPHRAEGYTVTEDGYGNAPLLDPLVPFSAGSLASTVEDIQHYLDAVHRKNLLGDGIRDTLYTQKPFPDGETNPYALGALVIRTWEGHRKIAHAGDIDGFSAYMAYYPDEDVSIVVLANTREVSPTPVGIEQKIARILFDTPRPSNAAGPLTESQITALVGNYDIGSMRIGLDRVGIVAQDGGIAVRFGGTAAPTDAIPLVLISDMTFYAAHDDEMVFSFGAGAKDGAADLTVDYTGGVFAFSKTEE
ncbi:serine hydrolase domain-containing protein [Hyphomonas sp.]|jgi:CubicO group peptidase (beta-lactamase class C family)|uniref:serine hydrolase domain-containing protein n=1 Tax=Hyphomonas sp. TaxID=87 RepID=UPI0032D97FB2